MVALSALETEFVEAVDEILDAFGDQPHIFITQENATVDKSAGTVIDASPEEFIVLGSPSTGYKLMDIDGDLVLQGDRKIFTRGTVTFDVEKILFVRDPAGDTWEVISVTPYSTGVNIAAYAWQLRK